jgi:hypothetical protein
MDFKTLDPKYIHRCNEVEGLISGRSTPWDFLGSNHKGYAPFIDT